MSNLKWHFKVSVTHVYIIFLNIYLIVSVGNGVNIVLFRDILIRGSVVTRRDLPSVNFTYTLYNRRSVVPPGVIAASGSVLLIYPLGRTHSQSRDRRPHTRRLWFSFGLCNVTTFDPIERASHPPRNPFTTPWRLFTRINPACIPVVVT